MQAVVDESVRKVVVALLKRGIKPSDILSKEAFENAITTVIALGGSTNAVLHLLAIAHAANVPLELDDFTRIGKKVPVLADLRPSGKYMMSELIRIGGIQPLMKILLQEGLLHGDCLTVTGKTLAQNLRGVKPYPKNQDIVRALSDPIKPDSHLVVLYGNLAPEGSVAKITGKEGLSFTGTARVFNGEEASVQAILDGKVAAGDVVVPRRTTGTQAPLSARSSAARRSRSTPAGDRLVPGLGEALVGSPSHQQSVTGREVIPGELVERVVEARRHQCGACMPWRNDMPIWIVRGPRIDVRAAWKDWAPTSRYHSSRAGPASQLRRPALPS